jgi:hypothetical protein
LTPPFEATDTDCCRSRYRVLPLWVPCFVFRPPMTEFFGREISANIADMFSEAPFRVSSLQAERAFSHADDEAALLENI